MCILLDSKVVVSNAFFAQSEKKNSFIAMSDLRKFCDILYAELTKKEERSCKYVCFQVDQNDIEDFCREDHRFTKGMNKIYSIDRIKAEEVNKINAIYSIEVRKSIESARKKFAGK